MLEIGNAFYTLYSCLDICVMLVILCDIYHMWCIFWFKLLCCLMWCVIVLCACSIYSKPGDCAGCVLSLVNVNDCVRNIMKCVSWYRLFADMLYIQQTWWLWGTHSIISHINDCFMNIMICVSWYRFFCFAIYQ